jgi:hypothetical protein
LGAGRKVRSLESGCHVAVTHEILWDARNDRGRAVASGLYFIHPVSRVGSEILRLNLLR